MAPTVLAIKIFDEDCEICKHMERHDRSVFEGFPEVSYQKINLEDLIQNHVDAVRLAVYMSLERYALNPDYTVDLPVYLLINKKGQYLGHHKGEATVAELRERVKTILSAELEGT